MCYSTIFVTFSLFIANVCPGPNYVNVFYLFALAFNDGVGLVAI